jgi:hypothetical protein
LQRITRTIARARRASRNPALVVEVGGRMLCADTAAIAGLRGLDRAERIQACPDPMPSSHQPAQGQATPFTA